MRTPFLFCLPKAVDINSPTLLVSESYPQALRERYNDKISLFAHAYGTRFPHVVANLYN